MNRFTIGLTGELVVSVTMTSVSPFGMPVVSRVTLKLPLELAVTSGTGVWVNLSASTSIL